MIKAFILAVTCTALVSCGPLSKGGVGDTLINAGKLVTGLGGGAEEPAPSPEMASAQPEDVLVISIAALGLATPTVRVGQNGSVSTWRADQGFSFSFDNDILVATRGLGDDLIGSDANGVRAAIAAGGGTVSRAHSYLGALDQIVLRETTCTITRIGSEDVPTLTGSTRNLVRHNESCTGRTIAFENIYWTNEAGDIMRSQQLVSPSLAYLVTDRL